MEPAAAPAPAAPAPAAPSGGGPAQPARFFDHLDAVDGAVPDRPVQIQDEPPPQKARGVETAPEMPGETTEPEDVEAQEPDPNEPTLDVEQELEQLRQLRQTLDGEMLPDQLHDRQLKVSVGGREMTISVGEAAKGYMRTADYSRKMAEVSQVREEGLALKSGAQRLLQDLNTPETLLSAAKHLGFKQALVGAAKLIAKERLALQQLPPEAREFALRLEEERDARELLERQRQQLEERLRAQEAQKPSEEQQYMKHQLDQLVPRAFSKYKIGSYPLAQRLFTENIQSLYDGKVTVELVDQAAQATAEQLADIATRLPAEQRPSNGNGGAQPLPARRVAPAAGKPVARQKSGSPMDFGKYLDRLSSR